MEEEGLGLMRLISVHRDSRSHRAAKYLFPRVSEFLISPGCQKTFSPGFQNFLLHMAARTTSWTGIPGTALHRVSKFVLPQGFKISFCTGLPNVFFHRASKYFLPQHLFCNDPYKFWLSQGAENLLLQNIFRHMF